MSDEVAIALISSLTGVLSTVLTRVLIAVNHLRSDIAQLRALIEGAK